MQELSITLEVICKSFAVVNFMRSKISGFFVLCCYRCLFAGWFTIESMLAESSPPLNMDFIVRLLAS